ncbi:MAG TPA: glycoside hydrolase family 28 protein [Chitinophagaceae bacterium]
MNRLFPICTILLLVALSAEVRAQLPRPALPVFRKDTISIASFGAKPDGITLNTKSINEAIAACAKKGGGVVLVPAGNWLSGPLVLQSNVNLHLAQNALLQFSKDHNQYPLVAGNFEGVPAARNQSPISATGASNIAITGSGIIDGNGDTWRMVKREKLNETQWENLVASGGLLSEDKKTWYPSEQSLKGSQTKDAGILKNGKTIQDFEDIKGFLRPNLLVLTSCKKVLLEGVTFQNSPAWCLHPLMCDGLTVRNIYAKNPWYAQNGDGIDVESCKNVLLENSTFDVGDDGICIKSGRDEEGRKRNMPTEDMVVRNCTVYHAHGGFVIGSEMSGGVRNLYVYDCTFINTDVGLRFKTARGRGGIVEKIYVRNINMKDIAGEAILFDMYYMAKDPVPLAGEKREAPKVETMPVTVATPQFRDFHVSGIVCTGAQKAIFIRGLPEMKIKDIWLDNMVLKTVEGIDCTEATGIHFSNINLLTTAPGPAAGFHDSSDITVNKVSFQPNYY